MRRRKKRKKRRILFLLVLLLIISSGIYAYFHFKPVVANKYEVSQTISVKESVYSYALMGNKIVIFENNVLKIYDNEEKIESRKIDINMKAVDIRTIGQNLFLADTQSGKIIIWNDQLEIIDEINLNEEILLIKEDKMDQYLGIHTKKVDGTERILLISKDGEITGEINGLKGGNVIDFTFDSEKEIVAISAISYNQEYKTNLMITDIQGKITGGKIFKNEIIPKIFLNNHGHIICVGTNRIIKLNEDKEIGWENTIVVDKVGYSELNDALVICEEGLTKTKVTLLDSQNNVLYEVSIDGNVKNIKGNSKRTILYGKRTICDIGKTSLSETKIYKDIEWVDVRSDGNIIMCNNKTIEVLKQKQ
ncbi:MAG: DUF5711 family protein [Clostridia bacterium]|nr:DUF5711 family protein [Clostridia bacterium]